MIDRNEIKRLIEAHGVEETLDICFEECGELVQAISKMKRACRAEEGIAKAQIDLMEEMADVFICMEMLGETFAIPQSNIDAVVGIKMVRNMKRIGEANE
jgi:NTP pyrophosphatase (non-canonical NTP hydrolase)